ncbi:MAG: DUF192 domain-containing protein [Actinomycetota bacterium]
MPRSLVIERTGEVLCRDLRRASGVRERTKGLIGLDSLEEGVGLVLEPCRQVHTFGMRFPIDVVFVDRGWTVIGSVHRMGPRRLSRIFFRARRAIELPSGAAAAVKVGDRLEVRG